MLYNAVTDGDYHGLKAFHYKSMFVGFMHFMDPYTYEVDRVERCDIHYAMPDGRVVPFCAFNVICVWVHEVHETNKHTLVMESL